MHASFACTRENKQWLAQQYGWWLLPRDGALASRRFLATADLAATASVEEDGLLLYALATLCRELGVECILPRLRCDRYGAITARATTTYGHVYAVMAYVLMACVVMAYLVMAYLGMAYVAIAYVVMAYIVMAYVVMAYVGMAYWPM